MTLPDLPRELPGSELIADGAADFSTGNITIASCLIAIAEPRLRRAGLELPPAAVPIRDPEHRLYRLLGQQPGDAYSRYNSLLRRLISLEQALDQRAICAARPGHTPATYR